MVICTHLFDMPASKWYPVNITLRIQLMLLFIRSQITNHKMSYLLLLVNPTSNGLLSSGHQLIIHHIIMIISQTSYLWRHSSHIGLNSSYLNIVFAATVLQPAGVWCCLWTQLYFYTDIAGIVVLWTQLWFWWYFAGVVVMDTTSSGGILQVQLLWTQLQFWWYSVQHHHGHKFKWCSTQVQMGHCSNYIITKNTCDFISENSCGPHLKIMEQE